MLVSGFFCEENSYFFAFSIMTYYVEDKGWRVWKYRLTMKLTYRVIFSSAMLKYLFSKVKDKQYFPPVSFSVVHRWKLKQQKRLLAAVAQQTHPCDAPRQSALPCKLINGFFLCSGQTMYARWSKENKEIWGSLKGKDEFW